MAIEACRTAVLGGHVRRCADCERFFGLLTEGQIRRGAHRSTAELEAAITAYIDACNADPKPFRWTKSADDILAAIARFCQRTIDVQSQCD